MITESLAEKLQLEEVLSDQECFYHRKKLKCTIMSDSIVSLGDL